VIVVLIVILVTNVVAAAFPIFLTNSSIKLPFVLQAVSMIKKHKPSSPTEQVATLFTKGESKPIANISSSLSTSPCIVFDPPSRTITVSCSSAITLYDVYNKLHDSSILDKQSPAGVWFLNANLVIAKGATFHINSTDTKWLKISSKVTGGSAANSTSATELGPAYWIDVHGSLKIDSVKITSWDPTTNNYAITNGSRELVGHGTKAANADGYIIHFGVPRPFIKIEHDATGTTNITNSEIAYLGYESGSTSNIGSGGLNYYGGNGSTISGNRIHDLYFGFYSNGVSHFVLQNNQVYNNTNYGFDPHTGTHDIVIRNNVVYNNGAHTKAQGIICSLNCYNVLIENNRLYHNGNAGIMFSRNMYDSIARNNIVYSEPKGIIVSQSHNNQIYNNAVSNSGDGIQLSSGSTNNKIQNNTITSSKSHAILINPGSSGNAFYSNKIFGAALNTTGH